VEIKITTLNENTAGHGCLGEWGLSILVEADGQRILVDAGPGFSTAYNAQRLGLDLSDIDHTCSATDMATTPEACGTCCV
jgi:7,8-dihydropterin-6-yl-methyl-4-(beta-D-ribofuranosyl)aminobenzene 5'-phosphate synthase